MVDAGSSEIQQRIIRALLDPGRYPHAADDVEHLETHISHILLAGNFAYKIKKPLNLGFLDFGTLSRRRFCCDEELRLNRRLAPDYYLRTVAITGEPDAPVISDTAEGAIEFAVQMRRFPQARLMDRLLVSGGVSPEHLDALADKVAAFHERIDRYPPEFCGTPESMHRAALENFLQLSDRVKNEATLQLLDELERWTQSAYLKIRPSLARRASEGWVRDCHGDLHLGNIALLDEGPLIFDCVEFAPNLRWMDVQSEAAFTVMDLISRGHPEMAWRFMNRYLERTGDYAGLITLQYFLVYRAMVRAKVSGIRAVQSTAHDAETARDRYLFLAQSFQRRRRPFLAITHGLSGSGKSTVAGILAEAGASIRVRSDVERKRLAGLAMESPSGSALDAGMYSDSFSERTYARIRELAAAVLDAGYPVVVDATFISRGRRRPFLELARERGVRPVILTTHAPIPMLRQWLRERQAGRGGPSEADERVLERQLGRAEPLDEQEQGYEVRIDTAASRDRSAICTCIASLLVEA